MGMAKWLTTTEVGERIGRSRQDVVRLLQHPKHTYFPDAYRMPGGAYRITDRDVTAFLDRMRNSAKAVRRRRPSQPEHPAQ